MSAPEEGVTVVVVRTVKAGMIEKCEAWLHDVAEIAGHFAGHMGMTVFRPRPGSRDFTFVFRFDTVENLEIWERSVERERLLARAAEFTEKAIVERHTGLETWFAHPDAPLLVPPRWKMVVVSFGVAFPLIQILSRAMGLVPIHPLARGALMGITMVVTMTYVAMPSVTKLLRGWLYRAK